MQTDINDLFKKMAGLKVAVIGDVMLDTYWWGHVERISPEAPVPVVAVDKKEERIGGAGNVALNVAAMGAQTLLLSVIGNDEDGIFLRKTLKENGISDESLNISNHRITTNKIRIISRNQQMLRLDAEKVNDLTFDDEKDFNEIIKNVLITMHPDVVILQDYNKGVLTENVIVYVLQLCKELNIISAVDPKRKNFFAYKNATLFKPNLKEVKENLNLLSVEINTNGLSQIHKQLKEKLNNEISLITLSDNGVFYQDQNSSTILPAHIRNVADVSGAGDTVIAVAALAYAASRDMKIAANMANIAGGLVCEQVGTAVINKERLMQECINLIK
ncbi:D-glycero-beta-D-manno-heptose-7-phosphate kinase [soil metagenome]